MRSSGGVRSSADKHVHTRVSEHGARHSLRLAGAQTAQKQHAWLLELG